MVEADRSVLQWRTLKVQQTLSFDSIICLSVFHWMWNALLVDRFRTCEGHKRIDGQVTRHVCPAADHPVLYSKPKVSSASTTAPHHTTSHRTTPHHITPHHITPHHTAPHHTTLHHTTPHRTTLHHITLHHTIPHRTALHYNN